MEENKTIKSFQDLRVYQNLYKAMTVVLKTLIRSLPKEEKYDLVDQMRRCSKACPALLAEGFAKRYQKANWKKYLDDTVGEANEMIHHLSVCIDIYPTCVDVKLCKEVIDLYDFSCKQLTSLKKAWVNYRENH